LHQVRIAAFREYLLPHCDLRNSEEKIQPLTHFSVVNSIFFPVVACWRRMSEPGAIQLRSQCYSHWTIFNPDESQKGWFRDARVLREQPRLCI